MGGLIKNASKFDADVNVRMQQVKGLGVEMYKSFIWEVFKRVLRSTPQWSGKAVANWNLSVGAPNYSFDDSLGDEVSLYDIARQRGDEKWMRVARNRNRPILATIRYGNKVFISNGVRGDDDGGASGTNYLESLQNSTYWGQKLRLVNQPYETLQETLIIVGTQYGRRGVSLPRLSGESWDQ